MKKIAFVLALAILASCLCVLLTGCGASNTLIGTWEAWGTFFTFKSDGTGLVTGQFGDIVRFEYEDIGDGRIWMSFEGEDGGYVRHEIKGDKLTLVVDDEDFHQTVTLKRKK